jgi:hypothetical protein
MGHSHDRCREWFAFIAGFERLRRGKTLVILDIFFRQIAQGAFLLKQLLKEAKRGPFFQLDFSADDSSHVLISKVRSFHS